MDRQFINKMIQNCLMHYANDFSCLNKNDQEKLCEQVIKRKKDNLNTDLYEIVNDIVYDYLTENGEPW